MFYVNHHSSNVLSSNNKNFCLFGLQIVDPAPFDSSLMQRILTPVNYVYCNSYGSHFFSMIHLLANFVQY